MCGVVGIWRRDGGAIDPGDIDRMLAPIAHRGPDDAGAWRGLNVALGHRRLSIIDLSAAGHQPMVTADGAGVLVYNGEVYNYRELRRELERESAVFRGNSDTEVVLEALHRWGPEYAIPRFNGMFAFGYFDQREGALWLARDRTGIKQIYIADTGRELLFGSEIKALLAHPKLTARPDPAKLIKALVLKRRGHETLFEGVEGLLPGSWWKLTAGSIEKRNYFDFETAIDIDRLVAAHRETDIGSYVEKFRKGLTESVRLHLISDAPVGVMCSGGLDSSLIAAYAHDDLKGITGYVADLPPGAGEGAAAELVGRHIGMPIRRIEVERDAYLRLWPEAIRHLDGPPFHRSDTALLAVTKACRADGIKVLLTGEGADEMFGGYPWQHATYRRWRLRAWMMRFLPRLFGRNVRQRWHAFPIKGMWGAGDHLLWNRLSMGLDADNALLPRRLMGRLSGLPTLADRAFFADGVADMTGILSLLLHRHDHMGMAASIEMRVPFLENDLIDFALHLPRHAKLNRGRGKWVEKVAALERLPREIVLAKKRPFPIPADFMRGSERLLKDGMLADQFGWSCATADAIIRDCKWAAKWAADLRSSAVGMELWLRQRFGGETAEAQGETLARLAHAPQ